nr:MAG TPA: hypothetical protein [Caudoviricetes sp.]
MFTSLSAIIITYGTPYVNTFFKKNKKNQEVSKILEKQGIKLY